jgi:hypothetical protein
MQWTGQLTAGDERMNRLCRESSLDARQQVEAALPVDAVG